MTNEINLWLVMTVIGVSIALVWAYIDLYKTDRHNRRYRILHQAGAENGLSITSQEDIAGGILGFDHLRKVLLVLQLDGPHPSWYTIRLADVTACSVFTAYSAQPTAITNLYSLGGLTEEVVLQFEFSDGRSPAAVPFYSARHHTVADLAELEQKVRNWQQFLLKHLEQKHLNRA